ncbi:hypothetical protein [Pedococcus sp. 2YAF34]|uniref:hypothetical protein n=1 Tax=Pedococcus sp. 2YAF34 TaxID=3233032 RepID=UPI003F9E1879
MTSSEDHEDRALLALARAAARNAQTLITEIERNDLIMAQGYASAIQRQMEELHQQLAAQRELEGPTVLRGPNINPYSDPLDGRFGDMGALRASMTVERLQEYCRYWDWTLNRTSNPHSRWWISKAISAAQRELSERGVDPYSWLPANGPS